MKIPSVLWKQVGRYRREVSANAWTQQQEKLHLELPLFRCKIKSIIKYECRKRSVIVLVLMQHRIFLQFSPSHSSWCFCLSYRADYLAPVPSLGLCKRHSHWKARMENYSAALAGWEWSSFWALWSRSSKMCLRVVKKQKPETINWRKSQHCQYLWPQVCSCYELPMVHCHPGAKSCGCSHEWAHGAHTVVNSAIRLGLGIIWNRCNCYFCGVILNLSIRCAQRKHCWNFHTALLQTFKNHKALNLKGFKRYIYIIADCFLTNI